MPSGRTHDRVTLWSLPLIAGATLFFTRRADFALCLSSGFLFSGLMFGPDLDLHSRQSIRWGKLRWIWYPYKKAIRHRSIWSHGPLIGTIGRILYLSLWLALAMLCGLALYQFIWGRAYEDKQVIPLVQHTIGQNYPLYIALFCGLELGAMSHYIADWLGSIYKRLTKGKEVRKKGSKSRKQR